MPCRPQQHCLLQHQQIACTFLTAPLTGCAHVSPPASPFFSLPQILVVNLLKAKPEAGQAFVQYLVTGVAGGVAPGDEDGEEGGDAVGFR